MAVVIDPRDGPQPVHRALVNFKDEILEAAGDEAIHSVVILSADHRPDRNAPMGVLMSWEEAAPWLDYEHRAGAWSQECHMIHAWTHTRVLFVGEYDGTTWIESVPRNPTAGATNDH